MNRRYPPAFTLSFLLHLVFATLVVSLSTRPILIRTVRGTIGAHASVRVIPLLPESVKTPQLPEPVETPRDDEIFRLDQESATINISGFEFDVRKIAARAASLFPFLRPERLTFPRVAPREGGVAEGFVTLFDQTPRDPPRAPLVLGDGALQVIVDGAWSRRERWRPFQSVLSFANTYNAQTGRMPELLRRYVDQNALQPYLDTAARDPRLWVELGIAADHRDFIEFVNSYASEHPSTKATTELLFLLDKFAQGSFDALITLLDARPEDLRLTRQVNRDAFDLLMVMQRYYRSELDLRDLATRYALRTHYDNVRLTILKAVINTTPGGYRASDARFLIGCIYWRAGNFRDAVRSWWHLNIDSADSYIVPYSQVLAAIRGVAAQDPSTLDPATITRVVDRVLDADRSRWISSSSDRLRQFGYAFDRF
jgi:hypothetical protein